MFGTQTSTPFGAAPSSPSLFGAASQGSTFGAATSAAGGLFGAPSPSAGTLFGVTAASPFGAATPSLFGASQAASSPLGATQSKGLFGAPPSTGGGLFGATQPAASAPGLFGASSASLFGASSAGLFGAPASSAGLFGAQPATGGLFGAPASSASLFGGTGALFGAPQSQPGQGLFGATALAPQTGGTLFGPQPAQQQQLQQQQQQLQVEMGKDNRPITHETNFSDLPDHWQNAFKAVHGKIAEARRDWRALQASVQVQQSAQPAQEYEDLTRTAKQLSTDLERARKQLELDADAAERLHADARRLAEATQEVQVQLRANVVRREIETVRDEAQKQAKILQNAQLFKAMPPLPAPYLATAIQGFATELQRLEDLHQGLAALCSVNGPKSDLRAASTGNLACLPDVMRSLHELFLHVAARMSRLLAAAERMRDAHMQAQAARGVHFNPFAEADARAAMEKEERNRLPAIQPVKPTAAAGQGGAAATATQPSFTPIGAASTPQLGLPAPASTPSLFGGGTTFGSGGARSNVKAKRR